MSIQFPFYSTKIGWNKTMLANQDLLFHFPHPYLVEILSVIGIIITRTWFHDLRYFLLTYFDLFLMAKKYCGLDLIKTWFPPTPSPSLSPPSDKCISSFSHREVVMEIVVALLEERVLLTPKICSSYPIIIFFKIYFWYHYFVQINFFYILNQFLLVVLYLITFTFKILNLRSKWSIKILKNLF